MSLRSRLILAFMAVVSLLLVVGATSLYVNRWMQTQVAHLRSSGGADLRRVDILNVGLEIEGFWDPSHTFVATGVEVLPGSRRPKLRGTIQALNSTDRTITIYGVDVHISDETEFDAPKGAGELAALRPGQRVEVSCRVVDGQWTARKIKTRGVKGNDKIKGTATRAELDGKAPETLEIHGLAVSLAPKSTASPTGALRRIALATQMTLLLQQSRAAARELVGRGADGTTERDADPRSSAAPDERLLQTERDFGYYLERSHMEDEDGAEAPVPSAFAPWLRALTARQSLFREHVHTLRDLAATNTERARAFLDEVFDPFLQNDLRPILDEYRAEAEEAMADQLDVLSLRADTTMRVAVAMSGVAVLLAVVLGMLLWRSIHRPISALSAAAANLGRGYLDTRVEVTSRDELGVLAGTFNKMAEDLAKTTVSVSNLENVFDSMASALIILDPAGRVTSINRAALRLLDYEFGDLHGCPFEQVCPTPPTDPSAPVVRTAGDDNVVAVEERVFVKKDGACIPVSFSGAALRSQAGSLQGYVCVAQDLSERKRIEEQVRTALTEKELLLREVHHRVKNNMQVVSSLLAIQSSYTSDTWTREQFAQSQNRIRSMALIHEQLYRATDFAQLDLRTYLETLTAHLLRSFDGSDRATIDLQIEPLESDIDQAAACGLIVNELVTNSLKHAFPEGAHGKIRVSFSENDRGDRILSVADDGCGIPDHFDPSESAALGLTLVRSLVKQFNGHVAFTNGHGTDVRIVFPTPIAERRAS